MNKPKLSLIISALYLLFVGCVIASDLYTRVYNTGNSEMAGLASYLFTLPSSALIDWISTTVFRVEVGSSNAAFVTVFGFSAILNAVVIYLILNLFSFVRGQKTIIERKNKNT